MRRISKVGWIKSLWIWQHQGREGDCISISEEKKSRELKKQEEKMDENVKKEL